LHLVGILFPRIDDDAWSKSHQTSIDVYAQLVKSTCFGHYYAHHQENRLYKTACGVSLDVLAAVVWSWDTS